MMIKKDLSNLQADKPAPLTRFPIMISSCLLGIHCRYDGGKCDSYGIINFVPSANTIPFCPEQLGGLPTPRPPANIVGGDGRDVLSGRARVINSLEEDVTDAFKKGAEESLKLARLTGAGIALLKDKSPSCGLCTPYCEKSTGPGIGVTAALLDSSGIKIMDISPENNFPQRDFLGLLKKIGNCLAL